MYSSAHLCLGRHTSWLSLHVCSNAVVLIHWHVFESDAVDKPLCPLANRICGCSFWALAPFLLFLVFCCCFAVPSGETQVWLGDLRVVVFGCFCGFCVLFCSICLLKMDISCPCTNVFPTAYAHVRTEPLARHRPNSRKKNLEQCASYQSTNACVAINCIRCERVDTGC